MAKQFYEINADLVERIKSVMNEANERANAFAARLNYNPSNLSGILNGKRPVPASLIDAICKTYIVDKGWLLTGEEKQTPALSSCPPHLCNLYAQAWRKIGKCKQNARTHKHPTNTKICKGACRGCAQRL